MSEMSVDMSASRQHSGLCVSQAGAGFTELPASPNEEEDDDEDDDGEVFPTTPPRVKPYSPFKVP